MPVRLELYLLCLLYWEVFAPSHLWSVDLWSALPQHPDPLLTLLPGVGQPILTNCHSVSGACCRLHFRRYLVHHLQAVFQASVCEALSSDGAIALESFPRTNPCRRIGLLSCAKANANVVALQYGRHGGLLGIPLVLRRRPVRGSMWWWWG